MEKDERLEELKALLQDLERDSSTNEPLQKELFVTSVELAKRTGGERLLIGSNHSHD